MEQELTKKCSKCKLVLPIKEFSSNGYCSKCRKDYKREYNKIQEHIEKHKKDMRIRRKISEKWKLKRKIRTAKPEHRIYMREYILRKIKNDPLFRLSCNLRRQIGKRLRRYCKNNKIKNAEEYGIDFNKIISYLKPEINKICNNHVDHIIPASRFNLDNESEIKLCFSAENLQWLPKLENYRKHNNVRTEDLLELQRRINEDITMLEINILKQLLQFGEVIYSKEQNKTSSLPLVATK